MTPWYQQAPFLLLIAFAFAMAAEAFVISRKGQTDGSDYSRLLGLTIVVFLGVFSALVVSNEKNSAAAFGLLGAVAGFLVAKTGKS